MCYMEVFKKEQHAFAWSGLILGLPVPGTLLLVSDSLEATDTKQRSEE